VSASRIAAAFERARAERRAAFIPYLTAGDPCAGGTLRLAKELAGAGADVLELGVPFSDPIADGPVLQRAAARALARGTTLSDVWEIARSIRRATSLALVLFTYANPLLRRGVVRAAREARRSGIDAVLVTDLPPEEGREIATELHDAGLATIFLVSPTSPGKRMSAAAALSTGFLYVVSRAGTTGERASLPPGLPGTIARARAAVKASGVGRGLPVAVGFGIATPETASAAARLADGVVVGSALVAAAEASGSLQVVRDLGRSLANACRRPSRSAPGGVVASSV
jgi:tryptophan synthase alpha chain